MKTSDLYELFFRHFRPQRLRLFYRLFDVCRTTRVLDLGGGAFFWDLALAEGFPLPKITVVNLLPAGEDARDYLNWVIGDATKTGFGDGSFDIVFSNSLVEHLGDWSSQVRFAQEVRRLAPSYFVQTPDVRFPIEPHFATPFVHWFPESMRPFLIKNCTIWGLLDRCSLERCRELAREIKLLRPSQMKILFPDSDCITEYFMGLPKSIVVVRESKARWKAPS